jgi:hypothetical protein
VVVSIVVADGEDPMLVRAATAARLAELFGADETEDRLEFSESSTQLVVSYDGVEALADALAPDVDGG